MKYPKYLFLTYRTYEFQLLVSQFQSNHTDEECTSDDIANALQFSLAISTFHTLKRDKLFYYTCYDATWALAHALDGVMDDIDWHISDYVNDNATEVECSCSQMVNNFGGSSELHSLINGKLRTINFTGISVRIVGYTPVVVYSRTNIVLVVIADFYHVSYIYIHCQDPVHFDENGIREVSKLYVLQYRTSYVNGTQIHDIDKGGLTYRTSLIPVAYVCRDSKNLEFVEENKNSIWPGIMSVQRNN